jgi:preprotein translocase subunit Sss1
MSSSPNRLVAVIFGAVYLLVGLLGFLVTAGVDFAATDGGLLLGIFEVNPLHNIVHLLIGAALLIGGLKSVRAAKTVNIVVGAVYLLVGIVGFFIEGSALNILALNTADHFLHLVSALVLLGVGLGAERDERATTRGTRTV